MKSSKTHPGGGRALQVLCSTFGFEVVKFGTEGTAFSKARNDVDSNLEDREN